MRAYSNGTRNRASSSDSANKPGCLDGLARPERRHPTRRLAVLLVRPRRFEHQSTVVAGTPENVVGHRGHSARPNRVPSVGLTLARATIQPSIE